MRIHASVRFQKLCFCACHCFAERHQFRIELVSGVLNLRVPKPAHEARWLVEHKPRLSVGMLIDRQSDRHIETRLDVMPHHRDRDQRISDRVRQKPGRGLLLADPLAVIDCQETCEAAGAQHLTNATFEIVLTTRSCGYCWPTCFFKRSDLVLEGTNNVLEAPVADKGDMLYGDMLDHCSLLDAVAFYCKASGSCAFSAMSRSVLRNTTN